MDKQFFILIFGMIVFSVSAWSQADTVFVLPAEVTGATALTDSTFSVTTTHAADQLGQAYLPTAILSGYRLFDGFGRLYRVDSVTNATLNSSTMYVTELQNGLAPAGAGVVYRKQTYSECIPVVPMANSNVSPATLARIFNHNAVNGCTDISGLGGGGGGSVDSSLYVTITRLADSTAAVRADFPAPGGGGGTDDQLLSIDSTGRIFTLTLEDGGTASFQDIDTQLNEGEVDAFVSNNGYLTSDSTRYLESTSPTKIYTVQQLMFGVWQNAGYYDSIALKFSTLPPLYYYAGGQSNMFGFHIDASGDHSVDSSIVVWNHCNDAWEIADIDGIFAGNSSSPNSNVVCDRTDATGALKPSVSFARAVLRDNPERIIRFVSAPQGGTPITNWLQNQGGRWDEVTTPLNESGIPVLDNILWLQGETDGSLATQSYADSLRMLIDMFRALPQVDSNTVFIASYIRNNDADDAEINAQLDIIAEDTDVLTAVARRGIDTLTSHDGGTHFNNISIETIGQYYYDTYRSTPYYYLDPPTEPDTLHWEDDGSNNIRNKNGGMVYVGELPSFDNGTIFAATLDNDGFQLGQNGNGPFIRFSNNGANTSFIQAETNYINWALPSNGLSINNRLFINDNSVTQPSLDIKAGGYPFVFRDLDTATTEVGVLVYDSITDEVRAGDAGNIATEDIGGYFTGGNVEDNLQEAGASFLIAMSAIVDTSAAIRADFPAPGGGGTDDQTAVEVDITDAGGFYTGTEVETALQEVGDSITALRSGLQAIPSGASDGYAQSGSYDAVNDEIDVVMASPANNFSIGLSALVEDQDLTDSTAQVRSEIPTLVGSLTNDAGYLTSESDAIALAALVDSTAAVRADFPTSIPDDQTLSIDSTGRVFTLSIADGNSIMFKDIDTDTDTQLNEGEVDAFVANNGYLTSESDLIALAALVDTSAAIRADFPTPIPNTDDQTASEVSISDAGGYFVGGDVEAATQENATNVFALDALLGDLTTLSGRPSSSTNHGTFSGTTIPDNSTTNAALQSLETALEAIPGNQALAIDSTGRVFTISLTGGGSVVFEDTNTQLNESQVEAFIDGTETAFSGWDKNAADDFSGAWGDLTSVPAGFADNVDDDNQDVDLLDFSTGSGNFSISLDGVPNIETINLDGRYLTSESDAVALAALIDSTAAVRADFPVPIPDTDTQLTQEQVQDFVGGMVTGNTETLIGVTYDDAGNEFDFVVDGNLSNYTNDAGFITAEGDAVALAALADSTAAVRADFPTPIPNTDDQNISGSAFNATNGELTIGIEGGTNEVIDLDGRYIEKDTIYLNIVSNAGEFKTNDIGGNIYVNPSLNNAEIIYVGFATANTFGADGTFRLTEQTGGGNFATGTILTGNHGVGVDISSSPYTLATGDVISIERTVNPGGDTSITATLTIVK